MPVIPAPERIYSGTAAAEWHFRQENATFQSLKRAREFWSRSLTVAFQDAAAGNVTHQRNGEHDE
ncbi:MAG: hypothetical protein P4K94_07310, partial [Terracidiphilus sp.]|nr:hypothetical protein [Terracidiphilus sp.]